MFEIKTGDGHIALHGRLDASQVETARPRFDALDGTATADLSQLDYISSAGLGACSCARTNGCPQLATP